MIAIRYLKSNFFLDMIPLIPFLSILGSDWNMPFYLLKCLRLYSGYTRLFDLKVVTVQLREVFFLSKFRTVLKDPIIRED